MEELLTNPWFHELCFPQTIKIFKMDLTVVYILSLNMEFLLKNMFNQSPRKVHFDRFEIEKIN